MLDRGPGCTFNVVGLPNIEEGIGAAQEVDAASVAGRRRRPAPAGHLHDLHLLFPLPFAPPQRLSPDRNGGEEKGRNGGRMEEYLHPIPGLS